MTDKKAVTRIVAPKKKVVTRAVSPKNTKAPPRAKQPVKNTKAPTMAKQPVKKTKSPRAAVSPKKKATGGKSSIITGIYFDPTNNEYLSVYHDEILKHQDSDQFKNPPVGKTLSQLYQKENIHDYREWISMHDSEVYKALSERMFKIKPDVSNLDEGLEIIESGIHNGEKIEFPFTLYYSGIYDYVQYKKPVPRDGFKIYLGDLIHTQKKEARICHNRYKNIAIHKSLVIKSEIDHDQIEKDYAFGIKEEIINDIVSDIKHRNSFHALLLYGSDIVNKTREELHDMDIYALKAAFRDANTKISLSSIQNDAMATLILRLRGAIAESSNLKPEEKIALEQNMGFGQGISNK